MACLRAPQGVRTESSQILLRENLEAVSVDENAASNEFQRAETPPRVNLNTASREELMRLPGIGAGLAARIIEHRTRFGRFRRPEHLMMVEGIGAHRYVNIRQFIETK